MNSQMPLTLLSQELRLPGKVTAVLDQALDLAALSLRGYVRVLRLAWTLADLTGKSVPEAEDVDVALQLRQRMTD